MKTVYTSLKQEQVDLLLNLFNSPLLKGKRDAMYLLNFCTNTIPFEKWDEYTRILSKYIDLKDYKIKVV